MSVSNPPTSSETAPTSEDTPTHPSAAATQPVPVHPMPATFPEVSLPTSSGTPAPTVVAPLAIDPHSIHDGAKYQPEHQVCVRCGSTNLARGQVVQYSQRFQNAFFAPHRLTIGRLNSLLNLFPFRPLVKLDALACRDCGAVLLVVDTNKLRRAERNRD